MKETWCWLVLQVQDLQVLGGGCFLAENSSLARILEALC